MNVGELIEQLQKVDSTLPVCRVVLDPNHAGFEDHECEIVTDPYGQDYNKFAYEQLDFVYEGRKPYLNLDGELETGDVICLYF